MKLIKFEQAKQGNGKYAIRAKDLDSNFAKVKPLEGQDGNVPQYSINETPNGWSLNIFPPYPSGTEGPYVLAFNGTGLVWMPTQDCSTV